MIPTAGRRSCGVGEECVSLTQHDCADASTTAAIISGKTESPKQVKYKERERESDRWQVASIHTQGVQPSYMAQRLSGSAAARTHSAICSSTDMGVEGEEDALVRNSSRPPRRSQRRFREEARAWVCCFS